MTTTEVTAGGSRTPGYKRKWRNYLIDVGLQIRYTAFIILVAVFLTGALGYKIYEATQDTSKIIWMTGLVDPGSAGFLEQQFRSNDRIILLGIVGFGVVLVLSIAGAGIWITHKVAGPLFSITAVCGRIRDNKLAQPLRQLRKGDELQDFYSSFRDMYEALRKRASDDLRVLNTAITTLEAVERTSSMDESLEALRELRKAKADSLEP